MFLQKRMTSACLLRDDKTRFHADLSLLFFDAGPPAWSEIITKYKALDKSFCLTKPAKTTTSLQESSLSKYHWAENVLISCNSCFPWFHSPVVHYGCPAGCVNSEANSKQMDLMLVAFLLPTPPFLCQPEIQPRWETSSFYFYTRQTKALLL